jgi:hypothetical protein
MKIDLERSQIFRDVKKWFAGETEAGVGAEIQMLLADHFQELGGKIQDVHMGFLRGWLARNNGGRSLICGEGRIWRGTMR